MEMHIEKISKSFGEKQALVEFTHDFEPGIYGLLGPGGCGKSVLLGCIAQNFKPDDGSITFKPPVDVLPPLGYMPQHQTVYTSFSARRFLNHMAGLRGIKNPRKTIEKLLEIVRLRDMAHEQMRTYSRGMKKRVLLALALLGDPKIVLLDDPAAGLDCAERGSMGNFISRAASDRIVIIATNELEDIELIAGCIIRLENGRIVQE